MLEQAIIDAEALKEAALQNAEQAVIEKYQAEIKNAVESLLEQDEEDPFDEPLDDEDGLESDEELAKQMPLASTEGDKLCPCPDDEEEVDDGMRGVSEQVGDRRGRRDDRLLGSLRAGPARPADRRALQLVATPPARTPAPPPGAPSTTSTAASRSANALLIDMTKVPPPTNATVTWDPPVFGTNPR